MDISLYLVVYHFTSLNSHIPEQPVGPDIISVSFIVQGLWLFFCQFLAINHMHYDIFGILLIARFSQGIQKEQANPGKQGAFPLVFAHSLELI
jgi:hypothetical protein